jgi:hypothetical protein
MSATEKKIKGKRMIPEHEDIITAHRSYAEKHGISVAEVREKAANDDELRRELYRLAQAAALIRTNFPSRDQNRG